MSEENDKDLAMVEELFRFLQGELPDGYAVPRRRLPKLTEEQSWTVIWYLGNTYRKVSDAVNRCDVCGSIYHSAQGGKCLDFGRKPFHFCESCINGDAYSRKVHSRSNPNKEGRR